MNAVSINMFEAEPLRTSDGCIDVDLYIRAVGAVLHRSPRYRQRLQWIPIENRAVWVDDPGFNLDYHIRHAALPRPGSDEQLKKLCSRILAQQLDREHPLWEIWIIEGLQGNRFATVNKIHHCMLDGIAGADLAQTLFSQKPTCEIREAPPFVPHRAPSGWELFRDSLFRRGSLPSNIVRGMRDYHRDTDDLMDDLRLRARAVADLVGDMLQPAPASPFNGRLGPQRRLDWLEMELSQVKAISKACNCSVNDVVVAIVAGAVCEFLIWRCVHPEEIEFRLGAPVNVRREDERGKLGNRVSSWVLKLPIVESDPRKRIEMVKATTEQLKTSRQAHGLETMMKAAEWMPAAVLSLGMGAASKASNIFVTNIPGPQKPLYILGAKLLAFYPVAPLVGQTGLGIALISYVDKIFWGFNADHDLLPDLHRFVTMVDASFKELAAVFGVDVEGAASDTGVPALITLNAGTRSNGKRRHTVPLSSDPRDDAPAG